MAMIPYLVPSGIIVMWSGTVENIPTGWALCNGENDTPNLSHKFILACSDTTSIGDTGGRENVILAINDMPSHTHNANSGDISAGKPSGNISTVNDHTHNNIPAKISNATGGEMNTEIVLMRGGGNAAGELFATNWAGRSAGGHSHSFTGNDLAVHKHNITVSNTGGGNAINIFPNFYVLGFIIKL